MKYPRKIARPPLWECGRAGCATVQHTSKAAAATCRDKAARFPYPNAGRVEQGRTALEMRLAGAEWLVIAEVIGGSVNVAKSRAAGLVAAIIDAPTVPDAQKRQLGAHYYGPFFPGDREHWLPPTWSQIKNATDVWLHLIREARQHVQNIPSPSCFEPEYVLEQRRRWVPRQG